MIDNSKEYILCAAIWYDDGISRDDENAAIERGEKRIFPSHFRGATFQNTNIKTGFVIGQWRHGNVISILPTNPKMNGGITEKCQGFLTSTGRFVDRWQAAYIALNANQIYPETAYNQKWIEEHPTEYDYFDYEKFLEEEPSDLKFNQNPFKMLFSEDLY